MPKGPTTYKRFVEDAKNVHELWKVSSIGESNASSGYLTLLT